MAPSSKAKPRVRVSKNKKRNWNKYCDIKDVEDYLEEKRFDERIGGSVFLKADDELFFIQKTTEEPEDKEGPVQKSLRCFQNIGSFSKVPPPIKLPERFNKRIKNAITRADIKRKKALDAKSLKSAPPPPKNILKGDLFAIEMKDLWAQENEVDPEIQDLVQFRDEYTCKRTPKVPEHRYQKPSLLPAVEIPSSGASYNPSFEDHQKLLLEALKIEETKEKEELHIKRVLTDMFPTRAEAPTQESILEEMSQGLFEEPNSGDERDANSILISRNPPVSFEDRKTKSKKRRKKERKEQERLKGLEKLQKLRQHDVYRLRSIKSQIKEQDKLTGQKIEKNLQRKIDKMYKPRTLSKHKYEAPELEVNLSEELCDSLRNLKTEGNLLEDRYKSLQRRSLIEPRIVQKRKRKYKLKVQVKRSHRNFE